MKRLPGSALSVRLLISTVLLLSCLPGLSLANSASFTASVDRTQLNAHESLELILESDDPTLFGKPDLSPLDVLFEVLGSRQVNRLTSRDGRARATTRWIITLRPKQNGYVVIPPLRLGTIDSLPITLQVQEKPSSDDASALAPIFIDAHLDHESVYVQAQTLLTLRIYHSVSLYDDSSLTPLQMSDARVEPLGEPRTYEKLIGGVRHGVIEMRYAIYPQRSGALSIPAQLFSATPVGPNRSDDFQPFGPSQGKVIEVRSPVIPLTVKAKPAAYPADVPWLPASALSLSESWSPQPEQVKVGDSLTRSLTLKVEGLSSAQLPPLPASDLQDVRRYPDQPQLADQPSEQGVTGSRTEREALVPKRSGQVELPAIQLVWWNTGEDRLERSSLPARTLQVTNNPALLEAPVLNVAPAPQHSQGPALWPWQLSSALLAGTSLLGFALWWRARQRPAIVRPVPSGPSSRSLLDDLRRTCLDNDSQATRQALDAWARQQPETLAQMAGRFVPLSAALDGLNGALYSEVGQSWQGQELWNAVGALPSIAANPENTEHASSLPPLYPR
ncbi:MAG: BatD family protein [Pseudomonas sp.]